MSPSSGDAINYTNTVSILMMLPGSTPLLLLLVVIIKKKNANKKKAIYYTILENTEIYLTVTGLL